MYSYLMVKDDISFRNTGIWISASTTKLITIESIQFYRTFKPNICKIEFDANILDVTANILYVNANLP